ncbi:hypothetical protein TRAPUB_865 [Trametes pubescens]|uniref:Pentatricopeptide repeat-containing protein n=1 Tax=Trametes pubescens TaxID=154538 RepID=A0A1M2VKX8_TRAPU|nr:hypothetical protein TRAPUB_865 [Trametes pubescens]
MREVKTYPYPATAPDTTLFEETTDEYYAAGGDTQAHTGLYPSHAVADHPSTMLKNLVKEGNYADASRVHAELLEIGVEIPFHPVYHFAARQALYNPALSQRDRLESFERWWSLFPPRTGIEGPWRAIGSILTDLLRNAATPDIPLIVRFAVLAASKGYALTVWSKVIPVVASCAPSDVLLHFLGEFSSAAQHFETSIVHDGKNSTVTAGSPDSFRPAYIYNTTVRMLAGVGRTGVALEVLQLARSRDMHVTFRTYDFLLGRLRNNGDVDAVDTVISLRRAQRSPWYEPPAKEAILPSLKPPATTAQQPHTLASSSSDLSQAPTNNTGPSTSASNEMQTLITIARSLKHALASGTLSLPEASLSQVIGAYVLAGRSTLVRRLRILAYRHDELVPRWALAEMMNHFTCRRSLYTIMKEFESHFHLVGVPRGFADALWKERGAGRSNGIARMRPFIRRKYLPTAKHTHFVWRVFLAKASTRSHVEHLYLQFLEDVAASRDMPASAVPHIASLPSWKPSTDPEMFIRPIPSPCMFNVDHFALFMRAFLRLKKPASAARVVIDIYALGFQPTEQIFDLFVSALCYMPSHRLPTSTLDFFEKALEGARKDKLSAEQAQSRADLLPSNPRNECDSPKAQPLAFVYGAVMRRLLLDGREAEAAQIAERFVARVPYRQGSTPVIDRTLREPVIASVLASKPESMSPGEPICSY